MPKGASPDIPGVIAPPPLVFLGFLGLGLALHYGLNGMATGLPPAQRWAVAAALAALGIGFILWAAGLFHAKGNAARPWKPSTALVIDGVYKITRNPMYLSMAMLYAALALAADSAIALMLLLPAVIVIDVGVIRREERYLDAKFGDEYRAYKAAVRRWI